MTNEKGETWFVGKDVAEALGYPPKALRDHVDEEDKLTERTVLSGQRREVILINESGLYALVLSSKLPCYGRTIQAPIPWGGVGGGFLGCFFRYT